MLGIARSRSEKRITLPPNRWNRITSFHLPSKRRIAASTSAAADVGVYRFGIDIPLTHFFVRTSYFISVMRNSRLCNGTEENTMTLDAPEPIAAYLAAEEAKDPDALSRCFTEDGTVHDEGRDYRGRDAIRQWKQAADEKYRYVLQMVNAQTHGNEVIVRAHTTAR